MKIIVAGNGFVGSAVIAAIEKIAEVIIVDPRFNDNKVSDHSDADGIIVCVGTPEEEDGSCDITQIVSVLNYTPVGMPVLIKSTVPPNYLDMIVKRYVNNDICYSPEFLRAAYAKADFINQSYIILGGEDPGRLWEHLFEQSLPLYQGTIHTTLVEASMIKYATNTFLATKVSYFNQIYEMCQANGANYNLVSAVIACDPRIGTSHLMVPGPDGARGFGGACFPKDTSALLHYSKDININMSILDAAVSYNSTLRTEILKFAGVKLN